MLTEIKITGDFGDDCVARLFSCGERLISNSYSI